MDEQKLDDELFDDAAKADVPKAGEDEEKKDDELFDEEEDEEGDEEPRAPSELTGKDAEKLAAVVQRKSMALDKEKKRRKALELENEQLRAAKGDAPKPAVAIDPATIVEQVREGMRKEEEVKRKDAYRDSAKEEIKKLYQSTSIAKEEAKELLKIIETLPQTGNPADDVAFALSWHKQKSNQAYSTMPTFNGNAMGMSQSTTRGEISQAALEFAKVNAGMDEEEFKKFYARRTKPTVFSNKR